MRKILLVLAGIVLVLGCTGLLYQRIATWRDESRFAAPGKRIRLSNGRHLHYLSLGTGGPPVVFDSVLGASSLGWALVQPEVGKMTTALAYDRAGYGWSDPGQEPRNCLRMSEELYELISRSGTPGPYILVGASFGGCIVRLYAFQHPDRVAGMVLVDPAHEDQVTRMPASELPSMLPLRLFQAASRFGVLRLANLPVDIAAMNVLPPKSQSQAEAVGFRTDEIDAVVNETASLQLCFSDVRNTRSRLGPHPFGSRPLIVLTHREDRILQGEEARSYAVWVQMHRDLAAESTRGRQEFVEHSGHFIAVDQPGRVVNAIRTVVEEVRNGG